MTDVRLNPNTRTNVPYVFAGICSIGLAVTVIGTFLSWFRSGQRQRNSYEFTGLIDHLGFVNQPIIDLLLLGWAGIPLVSAVSVAMFASRFLRTAAAVSSVTALIPGTVSVFTLVQGPDETETFSVTTIGPATTTLGTVITILAAYGVFITTRRSWSNRSGNKKTVRNRD